MGYRSLGTGLVEWAIVFVIVCVHGPRDRDDAVDASSARVLLAAGYYKRLQSHVVGI